MSKYFSILLLVLLCDTSYSQINSDFRKEKTLHFKRIISSEQQKTPNQDDYDVTYYSLELVPDPVVKILSGVVKITGQVTGLTLDHVELNLWNDMTVTNVYLSEFPSNKLNYQRRDDILSVYLDAIYNQGEQFSIIIVYFGQPQNFSYPYFGFDDEIGQPMIWSLSEPFGARVWWPCKDVPSDKADSVDIRVTVPANLIVASNGSLNQTVTDGEKVTYWWHEKHPISTYLIFIAIYPYEVYYDDYVYSENTDTMKIHLYMFPQNYNKYKSTINKIKDMIACYASLFGEYPFIDEKYGQADFLGPGAMEHQTCTSFNYWFDDF